MQANVVKWGNSLGMRIPAAFAAQLHLQNNTAVNIRLVGNSIVVTPVRRKYTLDELLASLTPENRRQEVDCGQEIGHEVLPE
jgi:antitoxin MazE